MNRFLDSWPPHTVTTSAGEDKFTIFPGPQPFVGYAPPSRAGEPGGLSGAAARRSRLSFGCGVRVSAIPTVALDLCRRAGDQDQATGIGRRSTVAAHGR